MNLRDPSRPKNARGILMLASSPCAVPALTLVCRPAGGWYIYVLVPISFNEFAQKITHVDDTIGLQSFLTKFSADPELVLRTEFDMPAELKPSEAPPERTQSLLKQLDKSAAPPKDIEF